MNSRQRRKILRERVARGEHVPRTLEAFGTAHFQHDDLAEAIISDRRRAHGCRIVVGPVSLDKLVTNERKPSARAVEFSEPRAETDDRHKVRALRPRQRRSVEKLLARVNATP